MYISLPYLLHTPLDGFPVLYIATAESVIPLLYKVSPSGFESWEALQDQALDIPGATALDVDVMENYTYWINREKKVHSTGSYNLSKDTYNNYVPEFSTGGGGTLGFLSPRQKILC